MHARGQAGAAGVLILGTLVLILVVLLASYALTRLKGATDERALTVTRLERLADQLEKYVTVSQRLPCPADPVADTGQESVVAGTNNAACTFADTGTIPWQTIGARREDAYDGWGRKVTYRVYTGTSGSLTQTDGATMVQCDMEDGAPAGVTATATVATGVARGGLCRTNTDIYQRNTTPTQFVAGKGFTLTDHGTTYSDVAYVLVSHGSTGLGGYTASGARLENPLGEQRDNMRAAGPFTIRAFSNPDTSVTAPSHFDDLLFYRRIGDMATRTGLAARDWPEGAIFNAATAAAATQVNQGEYVFMGNRYLARRRDDATNTYQDRNFALETTGGVTGLGVSGAGGGFLRDGELVRVELAVAASRLAFTLAGFGKSGAGREQVLVRFYDNATDPNPIGTTLTRQGCRADGGLATFVVDAPEPGAAFRKVELESESVSNSGSSSEFLIAEIAACGSSVACDTTLATVGNRCAGPSLASVAFLPTTVTRPASSLLTFTFNNGTDNPAHNGLGFAATLPAGLTLASGALLTTCASAALTAPSTATSGVAVGATSFKVRNISLADGAVSCTVSVAVTSETAGSYEAQSSLITPTANFTNAISASSTLTVQ